MTSTLTQPLLAPAARLAWRIEARAHQLARVDHELAAIYRDLARDIAGAVKRSQDRLAALAGERDQAGAGSVDG